MDHERVGAGHLLAGIASLDVGAAAQVLASIGVDRGTLIDLVRDAMRTEVSGEQEDAS